MAYLSNINEAYRVLSSINIVSISIIINVIIIQML